MAKAIPNRVFEDYDPPSDLVTEDGRDTLLIYLPGFKKEQLKVQLTVSRMIKISGERPLGDNKFRRFQKEFRLPSNCDTREITAKFEGGILHIRQPKLITPAPPITMPSSQPHKAPAEVPPPPPQPPHPKPQQHAPPPPPQPQSPPQAPPSQFQPQQQTFPLPQPPQPQSQQQAPPPTPPPPPPPQPQPQLSKTQSQEKIPQKEDPGKGREEDVKEKEKAKEQKVKAMKRKQEEMRTQVVNSGLFRELKKPDNVKRLGVSVILVLIIAFYISYMFKSFMENGSDTVTGYYPEL